LENKADILEIFIGDGYLGSHHIIYFSKKLNLKKIKNFNLVNLSHFAV